MTPAPDPGPAGPGTAPGAGPGQALFQFVRFWSRRWTGAGQGVDPDRGRDVMVLEAVSSKAPRPASVRDVAEQLGLDQSGASRLVTSAEGRGLLTSTTDPLDARQRRVLLTHEGARLVAGARRWQEEVFLRLTTGWSRQEVEQFHKLMSRLTADAGSG